MPVGRVRPDIAAITPTRISEARAGLITPAFSVRASGGASPARRQPCLALSGNGSMSSGFLANALCKEAGRRFRHAGLLRGGCCDPLAQRHTAYLTRADNISLDRCRTLSGQDAHS